MEQLDYRVVSCEGGDQVGKADAVLNFSEKISSEGIPVTNSSFPIYATPIGNTIRTFLKEGGEIFGLSHEDELNIKMSLFALNRLELLDVLLSDEKYKETLILFDRSSFSNALTIAYAISMIPEINEDDIGEVVDLALKLDTFMIHSLGLNNCVVELVSEGESWQNLRGESVDLHESDEVQKLCQDVYGMYEEKIGEGWRKVVTKQDGQWRDREEIFNDIYEFAIGRLGRFDRKDQPMRYDIGVKEIVQSMYEGAQVYEDLLESYIKSIRDNDKKAMYELSVDIKEQICESTKRVKFVNEGVRDAMLEIFDRFPQLYDVLRYSLGESFAEIFFKGLNDE